MRLKGMFSALRDFRHNAEQNGRKWLNSESCSPDPTAKPMWTAELTRGRLAGRVEGVGHWSMSMC